MPEGVEVTVIVDQLNFFLRGRLLEKITIADNFRRRITGDLGLLVESLPLKFIRVWNKGKRIIFHLKSLSGSTVKDFWLYQSLMMTGHWSLNDHKHTRMSMELKSNEKLGFFNFTELRYIDQRIFGTIKIFSDSGELNKELENIAKPFLISSANASVELITYDEFYAGIKLCKKKSLTVCLLDQLLICSGVGNWIKSESLYAAKLSPWVRCDELTDENILVLFTEINRIMHSAYAHGGVSIENFVDMNGEQGNFQDHLQVYGRTTTDRGEKVEKTGSTADKRATYFVREVQLKSESK